MAELPTGQKVRAAAFLWSSTWLEEDPCLLAARHPLPLTAFPAPLSSCCYVNK